MGPRDLLSDPRGPLPQKTMKVLGRTSVRFGLGTALGAAVDVAATDEAKSRVLAVALVAIGLAFVARWMAQRLIGYGKLTDQDVARPPWERHRAARLHARVRRLMRWQLVAGVTATTAGLVLFWHPSGVAEATIAFAIYYWLLVLTGRLRRVASASDLKSVSEVIFGSPCATAMEKDLAVHVHDDGEDSPPPPTVARVREWMERLGRVTDGKSTASLLVVLSALFTVGSLSTYSAARQIGTFTYNKLETGKERRGGKERGGGHASTTATVAPAAAAPPKDPPAGQTPQRPVTSTPPPTPSPSQDYAQQCGTDVVPGDDADDEIPTARRQELHDLWLGGPTADGLGADVAGCAGLAKPLFARPDAWYAVGTCDGHVQSLGLSEPGTPPAILLQRVAEFALDKATSGALLGASRRANVTTGDLQIVNTTTGPYVLVRADVAAGGTSGDATCGASSSANVAYTVVPPGLLRRWLTYVAQHGWVWPVFAGSRGDGTKLYAMHADSPDRKLLVTATCDTDWSCAIPPDEPSTSMVGMSHPASLAEVLAHAPPTQRPTP